MLLEVIWLAAGVAASPMELEDLEAVATVRHPQLMEPLILVEAQEYGLGPAVVE
jgi:hypothetical protein